MKAWLVTALSRCSSLVRRAAILLTLPVAYHCIFLLGFGANSPRVLIHSLLGSALSWSA